MWGDLPKQAAAELALLRRLLEVYAPILSRAAAGEKPTDIEVSALASMLHSFYNGLENIFKRIAAQVDQAGAGGETWHRELLDSMAASSASRPAVISDSLKVSLEEFLRFRHRFRYSYTFDLKWERMSALVLNCQTVLDQFEFEIVAFLNREPDRSH